MRALPLPDQYPFMSFHCTKSRILLLFCLLMLAYTSNSQKREFRAAWIATVSNIDWPSKPGLPAYEQQQQFIHRLDQLKAIGCNAVIVQIRPASDALYASEIEPWSRFLTGAVGRAPSPYYDPLEFMLAETHKRDMEFHAWFNPFRALTDSKKNPNPANHITRTHPEWIISYGGKSYINPGEPEARDYVIRVIMDVVKRYDIDAVHLDDYFYPYRIAGVQFNDAGSFSRNNNNIVDKEDWRRNNVSLFVYALNNSIKTTKPYVKFGISPFGVWRNYPKDPDGSHTHGGQTNYDDLYSDIRLWLEKGWIDYALPQLYWEHHNRAAAFEVLLPWWRDHAYKRHVYYGLGLYRMLDAKGGIWAGTHELTSQIRDIREEAPSSGYALYSVSNFDRIRLPIEDSLQALGRQIALPPAMPWLDSIAPASPFMVKATSNGGGTFIQWQAVNPKNELLRFAVYRFRKGERMDIEDAAHLIAITGKPEYLDAAGGYNDVYMITALDRLWNESRPAAQQR